LQFILKVIPPEPVMRINITNAPPYFVSALESQRVIVGSVGSYILPAILDLEEDDFNIEVDLGSAKIFTKFDG
jgi:hypothetical protein